uniref:Uncharacterized protein n=1 Tax=Florenciella parvula TaxID=236787 RepID=A0A7S2D0N0_9STRA|mmetsp:Transcript_6842/g.14103  ORF Transcript_6842/g.14103 Transcript_6842/m.14103 type:complete len:246 (+) Transcript_6842:204-941(+)
MKLSSAIVVLFWALDANAQDCFRLCKGVLSSPEAAAAQRASCEKHNVTPRPVTLELCLGTFQGIAPSACTNACDGVSRVEPDLCGSVSASTWIPKHQAYKSCKSGYEGATQLIPALVRDVIVNDVGLQKELADKAAEEATQAMYAAQAAAERAAAAQAAASSAISEQAATAAQAAAAEKDASEFIFPVTVDEDTKIDLVVRVDQEPKDAVTDFCTEQMPTTIDDCVAQLLPAVIEQLELASKARE